MQQHKLELIQAPRQKYLIKIIIPLFHHDGLFHLTDVKLTRDQRKPFRKKLMRSLASDYNIVLSKDSSKRYYLLMD